jgi:hypothetical protein
LNEKLLREIDEDLGRTGDYGRVLYQDQRERDAMREELARRGINPDDHKPELWPAMLRGKNSKNGSESRIVVTSLADYDVKPVEWLERPFIQSSAFHLLTGRKGVCKGTWLCGLAARITRGRYYDGTPKNVIVVTSEDDIAIDYLPRFLAAGGDRERGKILNGFALPRDLEWLAQFAHELGDVGLIVIDPMSNHIGTRDSNKETEVRDAISGLNRLSADLETTIFGVRHLGKDNSRGALSSVLGSTAWVDLPRCVLAMAADDEDKMLFHLQCIAGNRGPKDMALKFRLCLVDVPPATDVNLLDGEGESNKDVEDLLIAKREERVSESATSSAREMILDLLDERGRMESSALDSEVAQKTDVKVGTIRNIRTKLKDHGLIRVFPDKNEAGQNIRWNIERTLAPRATSPYHSVNEEVKK